MTPPLTDALRRLALHQDLPECAQAADEIERLTAELTTTKANIRAALGGIGLLPKDPDDLLTTEQRREMDRDLQRMARQRRRVEAESAGLVLP